MKPDNFNHSPVTLTSLLETLKASRDFHLQAFTIAGKPFNLFYYSSLTDQTVFKKELLPCLRKAENSSLKEITEAIPFIEALIVKDVKKVEEKLLTGFLGLNLQGGTDECLLIPVKEQKHRDVTVPEVEFSVIGPKEGFIEDIDTNIYLIRKRLPVKNLINSEIEVGSLSKTRVAVLYLDGIADEENVNTIKQRVEDIEFDHIDDSSYINQLIEDNSKSPFPQLLDTERPDRTAASLTEGKVAVLVDGSPTAIIGPTTFLEFFSAFDDYFSNWIISSILRVIRVFSVAFSIFATAIYVAVLTYHTPLIPRDLLDTLVQSRDAIPFPPIIEAVFLELTIELLREAGARLPSKVGQTIGIVGGIVIGTAAVEAGLTSNVLLIIVALSALASFTTPIYRIGNTIRLLRFPFLFAAQLWGLVGIFIGIGFLLVHLLGLTSLGRPYLEPLYPLRLQDMKDSVIRLPFSRQSQRPVHMRPDNPKRFNKQQARKTRDIDD
ncbi:spore germination protein [Salipaludibacillus sp. CUR1]|uniref:spore germination protein n=1 Tax=Salipaludibacillus sp. CUR1 TaxID=2820003 RepID=UPI001E5F484C|nr:spore germination protein [Salipaludibacillus sp. CUR1]MCE7794449.1 spore germination protein [Salipaludibacillus sp. CUR1]